MTANVPYITFEVKKHFGNDHVLVSSDPLEIKDSHATKGEQFPIECVCMVGLQGIPVLVVTVAQKSISRFQYYSCMNNTNINTKVQLIAKILHNGSESGSAGHVSFVTCTITFAS